MKLQKTTVIVGIIVLMLSMMYATWISHRQSTLYTVDLGKITRAQMLFAGRLMQGQASKKVWMATINDATGRVQKTIHNIAGDHIVIVTPAVVQGSIDITDRVLTQLGLPTRIPEMHLPENAVLPHGFSKTKAPMLPTPKKAPAWTLP